MKKNRILKTFVATAVLAWAFTVAAQAETRIEKNLKLDPRGRFVLDSDAGSVTVSGAREPGAKVVITSRRDDLQELFDFNFEEAPGLVRITARKQHGLAWPKNLSLHYEVQVPAETRPEIRTGGGSIKVYGIRGNSDLRTSGGSIEVSGLMGHLEADTSGGSIALREVTGNTMVRTSGGGIEVDSLSGSLDGNTSGGPIRVEGADGDVNVETSGGPIRIERASGRVAARTSGGSVHVNFDRGNSQGGDLETSGGSIRVVLDPTVNLNLEASASSGGVTTDLPIKVAGRISRSSLHGSLGSGGQTLRMHTSGGSIHISGRPGAGVY